MSVLAAAFNWRGFTHALDHGHDSLLYVTLAQSIVQGEWLGQYNHLTLIRQPVYSLFLALNSILEFRLHIFQYALSIAATFLLCLALHRFSLRTVPVLLVFALIILHPMVLLVSFFTITESLYLPLTIVLLAGAGGIYGSSRSSFKALCFWIAVFSVSFALLWHTRTESIWLLPGFVWLFVSLVHLNKDRIRKFLPGLGLVLLLPVVLTGGTYHLISSVNHKHYGVRLTHELAEENFTRAFNELARVAPEHHQAYIPVPRKAMYKAFEVSPGFEKLQDFMSRQFHGRGWSRAGYEWMGIDDELVNGWFMWAVRDGAYHLGRHDSAPEASGYYGRIADEISRACQEKLISCTANPTGGMLSPPVTLEDMPRVFPSFFKMIRMTATFGEYSDAGPPFDPESHAAGETAETFAPITHDQVAQSPLFDSRFRHAHYDIYKAVHLACFVLLAVAVCLAAAVRNYRPDQLPGLYLAAFCLIMILSRTGIITYLDAFSFHAQIRYLFPVYPFLLAAPFVFPWNFKAMRSRFRACPDTGTS